ncbi:hypothetical protein GGX14DRAFT_571592 [Mycena pura]|uniref:Endonuclease/exonuclease/phosphatase domain-containing protein n=1 Tax=Mycena pura TaxID=153505 RepID=A0AAD6Y9M4_9AGAR|nr:hypothetical protein GGX14DRAFT_571592 [Mycena pura]
MRGGARQAPCANGELPPRADRQDDLPAPVITADYVGESAAAKPTGKKHTVSAKKERFGILKDRASEASSLDALAEVLQETIAAMRLLCGAPTKPLYELLEEIQTRLSNHHEYPCADESRESFSSVVTRAVASPVKALTAQVEAQQRAIQSLTKSVESVKNAPILAAQACGHGSFAKAAAAPPSPTKPKPPPLPNPSDERLLVRFDGQVPPILAMPYPDILATLNKSLARLGLPLLLYTQKQSESGIFIVPHTKNDLKVLTECWKDWGPAILPGGRVVPVATHCFLQVDGVPFAGAGTLEELGREFEERNTHLGPVVGTPTWVNKPPSEAKAAAMAAAGRKPPRAGSLFIRLQSRDMVDKAVAGGRVILAGTVPAVVRLGLTITFPFPPLDALAYRTLPRLVGSPFFPLPNGAAAARTPLMLRVVQSNTWKSRNPLEILMGVYDFDIIGLQEPWEKEAISFDHTGYVLIKPECESRHRVSFYFKEATIPVSSICPRPDLSTSPDLLIVDLVSKGRTIHLINLYNDCVTRAGVGLLSAALKRFSPREEILVIMDSNSHHVLWDSHTLTPTRVEDFDLHDLLIQHPLTLITPPDIPTHLPSGNVIDLGFASPSLPWNIGNVEVSSDLGLGSDHLPITYELDLEAQKTKSRRFNLDTMKVETFLSMLRLELGRPLPEIESQEALDEATDLLCEAPIAGKSPNVSQKVSHVITSPPYTRTLADPRIEALDAILPTVRLGTAPTTGSLKKSAPPNASKNTFALQDTPSRRHRRTPNRIHHENGDVSPAPPVRVRHLSAYAASLYSP